MEVRILVGDPREKAPNARIAPDRRDAGAEQGQLRVGEGPVQCAMTDRVDWHRLAAATAFGYWVMMFDGSPKRARAQPAILVVRVRHCRFGYCIGVVRPKPDQLRVTPACDNDKSWRCPQSPTGTAAS